MNLTGDFLEPEARIEVLADWVLVERLDAGVTNARAPEMIECVTDQLSSNALSAKFIRDRQIRDETRVGLAIQPRRDVAHDPPVDFGDENAVGIPCHISIDLAGT